MTKQIGTQITSFADSPPSADERIIVFGGDTNIDPTRSLQDLINYIRQGFTGSGLTQAQVDARIDALIPLAQRIPDFAVGDAGEVVTVNATGTGLEIAAQSGGSSDELQARSAIPAITGFALGDIINVNGDLYELIANTESANVYHGVFASRESGAYFGDDFIEFGINSPGNIRANIPKAGLATPPATLVIELHSAIDASHTLYDEFGLARASAQDTATTWGYAKDPSDSTRLDGSEVSAGQAFDVTFYTDATKATAQNVIAANRWAPKRRDVPSVRPPALVGNTDRWSKDKMPSDTVYTDGLPHVPAAAFTRYADGGVGLTLARTDRDTYHPGATLLSPGLDLDDTATGILFLELSIRVTPVSDANMGFRDGGTNQTADDRERDPSREVYLSELLQEDAIQTSAANTAPNGVRAFNIPMYSSATHLGDYRLYITRNANNQVGYYALWDAVAGGTGATFNATLRITYARNDALIAPTRNSRGRLLATSSAIPTALQATDADYTTITWTLEANAGIEAFGHQIYLPPMRLADDQDGYWFVVEVGGTEVSETKKLVHNTQMGRYAHLITEFSKSSPNQAKSVELSMENDLRLSIEGQGTTQPANTVIKVYMAVI